MFSPFRFDPLNYVLGNCRKVKIRKDIPLPRKTYATLGGVYFVETGSLRFVGNLIYQVDENVEIVVGRDSVYIRGEMGIPIGKTTFVVKPTLRYHFDRESRFTLELKFAATPFWRSFCMFYVPSLSSGSHVKTTKNLPITQASVDTSGLDLECSFWAQRGEGVRFNGGINGITAVIQLGPPLLRRKPIHEDCDEVYATEDFPSDSDDCHSFDQC